MDYQGDKMKKKELKNLILTSAKSLLDVCDGAKTEDGVGFNKFDARFVRDVLSKHYSNGELTDKQWEALRKALIKYKQQLKSMGHDYQSLVKNKMITVSRSQQKEKKVSVIVDDENGEVIFSTPFNRDWLNKFKDYVHYTKRTWDGSIKAWRVSITHDKEAVRTAIKVTEEVFDVEIDIDIPDKPFGVITLNKDEEMIEFDTEYNEDFIDKVKLFSTAEFDRGKKVWKVDIGRLMDIGLYIELIKEWNMEVDSEVYGFMQERREILREEKRKHKETVKLSKQKSLQSEYEVPLPDDDLELYPFQKFGVKMLDLRDKGLVADEMGCLSGETMIKVNRGGKGFEVKLKDMYKRFNNLNDKYDWDNDIKTYCESLCDDELRLNKVKKVLKQGKKKTLKMKLKSGREIVLTPDHEVKTGNGWEEVQNLEKGDVILVNGQEKCKKCGSTKDISEHLKKHKNHLNLDSSENVCFIPKKDKVESIEENGVEEVYDIVMKDPYRNFVANEIIVHNCGKTVEVLAHLYNKPERRPIICIVPSSVKINWKREIVKWTEANEDDVYIFKGQNGDEIPDDKSWYIINYTILQHRKEEIEQLNYKGIIIDESHYIKNPKALRTKAVNELAENIDHIYCLSGTPMPNRPVELWEQLKILKPNHDDFRSFWGNNGNPSFAKKYCGAIETQWGWDVKGSTNLNELHNKLRENIMIRRKKEDVIDELPEKQRYHIPIEINNRAEYNKALNKFKDWMEEQGNDSNWQEAELLVKMGKLRQLAWKGKANNVIDWIKNALTQKDKIIVFAHHIEFQKMLYEEFKEDAVYFSGGLTAEQRQEKIDQFTNDKDVKLFVASTKSACEGINLQVADTAVFVETLWTPSEHMQAEDRIYRIGQEADTVTIYYLIAERTVEEEIYHIIHEKQQKIDSAIDGMVDDSKKGILMQTIRNMTDDQ